MLSLYREPLRLRYGGVAGGVGSRRAMSCIAGTATSKGKLSPTQANRPERATWRVQGCGGKGG